MCNFYGSNYNRSIYTDSGTFHGLFYITIFLCFASWNFIRLKLLYVVIGLLGLPIFAAGGGLAYIVRPSFGYLIGFIAGAYVTGIICEKTNEIAAKKYVLAVLSGLLATYMIGLGYKYIILNYYTGTPITWKLVLLSCFPLDLPGDLFLSFLAVGTGIRFEKIFKKRRIQC